MKKFLGGLKDQQAVGLILTEPIAYNNKQTIDRERQ